MKLGGGYWGWAPVDALTISDEEGPSRFIHTQISLSALGGPRSTAEIGPSESCMQTSFRRYDAQLPVDLDPARRQVWRAHRCCSFLAIAPERAGGGEMVSSRLACAKKRSEEWLHLKAAESFPE